MTGTRVLVPENIVNAEKEGDQRWAQGLLVWGDFCKNWKVSDKFACTDQTLQALAEVYLQARLYLSLVQN